MMEVLAAARYSRSNLENIFFRPALAVSFVLLLISLGWVLAWKLLLVHIPLVQEIFGLREKPSAVKPPSRRFSRYYNDNNCPPSPSLSRSH